MSGLLAVLLLLLKIIGVILLVLLAALIILLFTPAGVEADWRPAGYAVYARLGFIKLLLAPRPPKPKKQKAKKREKSKKPEKQAAADDGAEKGEAAAQEKPSADEAAEKPENGAVAMVKARAGAFVKDLRENPLETLQSLLEFAAPLGGRLLCGIHIRRLIVVWTITRDDAAQTAVAYGQQIALANILLEKAQELVDIQAEELRLEPDFAGKMAEKRHLACQITLRPYIMVIIGVRLLWRLLRPAKNKNAKQ